MHGTCIEIKKNVYRYFDSFSPVKYLAELADGPTLST